MTWSENVERRFWAKVDRSGDCWLWTGARHSKGYGLFSVERTHLAHRFAYELLVGPIPEGLTIDHLCRNTSCVNPSHMEPVTNAENILRGESLSARNARKTHCHRGHEFTPENIYWQRGGRNCRTCRRASDEKNNRLKRERKAMAS